MVTPPSPPAWRTSSYTQNFDCVQVANLSHGAIGIRDSKNPNGPHLVVTRLEFAQLLFRVNSIENPRTC